MPEGSDAGIHAELVKVALPVVAEGGVTDVVPDGDGLDEVVVQPQPPADGPRDAGEQLHVDDPVGYALVPHEVEDLSLVNVGRVCL